jgi:hypothetical protein
MTRHCMVHTSAAGAILAATDPRAFMVIAEVDRRGSGPAPGSKRRAETQRSGPSASTLALHSGGRAIADISRNPKSP